MPYKNSEAQRKSNRERNAKRRADWFKGKSCVKCGSVERLEADHIDPSTKISNSVWSWAPDKMEAELAKCQVLCRPCHLEKSILEGTMIPFEKGENNPAAKLNQDIVRSIRQRVADGEMQKEVAEKLGIPKQTINNIIKRNSWAWVE